LQKVVVVLLGVLAFLMVFVPTLLHKSVSVLRYSYFAYTMYGVSITPALIAALAWKRATKAGGTASIVSGTLLILFFEFVVPAAWPGVMKGGDPWGIPSIYPSLLVSVLTLLIVSWATPPPKPAVLKKLFPDKT
ncbi:MAG TPA: hypothetical protein VGB38_05580, partial [bacterium]